MSVRQLGEAITRYHKILESDAYRDLGWAEALHEKMQSLRLTSSGRPISPFLRPHFLTRKQYEHLVTASEALHAAIDRVKRMTLADPVLQTRMGLLPAEKMLAQIDPGYSFLAVTSLLGTHIQNGSIQVTEYNAESPSGVAYGELLSDALYDAAPVKEFRKKNPLAKIGGSKYFLQALLKSFKEFGGKKQPNIAIVEFKQPFQTAESAEFALMAEQFRRLGYATEIVTPDQMEYRNGVLRRGDFAIDLVYRRVALQEFLIRYDLSHPLVRAYREGKVCVVNSFRTELARKKAIFDLLTDDAVTANFPAAERKVIREYLPWTRVVNNSKTTHGNDTVDLPAFILKNREKLILKPNDENTDSPSVRGWETDDTGWEKALKAATRTPYVVQERVAETPSTFPVYNWGSLDYREMNVDVQPHFFLGKVHGCSTHLSSATGFSSTAGLAATFILDTK
jgi:uncharacterized circularly permuted ATP-grasp superfamily protein